MALDRKNIGIGLRIKESRKNNGWTQTELAERMGYTSKVTISKVEKGQDNLTWDRIVKFANALNVSPQYLAFSETHDNNNSGSNNNDNDNDRVLIERYHKADPETQEMINRLLAYAENLKK